MNGALLFARYAYPPNALGYCGPRDSQALLEYVADGAADRGLTELARRFHGAWPYLTLIAATTGRDPLDADVVAAYWLGNRLLDRVPSRLLAAQLTDRFAKRAGPSWWEPATLAVLGGRPHHNFHVFAVYPWVGLLRAGYAAEPLRVLDSCRISWGTVVALAGESASVRLRPLRYDAGMLRLGEPVIRHAVQASGGYCLTAPVRIGDRVSVHWNWICDILGPTQLTNLRRNTLRQLHLVNHALGHPAVADALEPTHRTTLT